MLEVLIYELIIPSRVLFTPNYAEQRVYTPLTCKDKHMNGILNIEVPFC